MSSSQRSARFAFPHLLTKDAAYAALLAVNRRALHSAAADELAQRYVPGTPGALAALLQLQRHLEGAERWQEAHSRACAVLDLRVDLGRTADWERLAVHAAGLWQRARRQDPALPDSSPELLLSRARYCAWIGELSEAHDCAGAAYRLAAATGNALLQANALNQQGNAHFFFEQWEQAAACYREALASYRAHQDELGELRMLNNLAAALDHGGQKEAGRVQAETGMALARRIGYLPSLASLSLNMGRYMLETGELNRAEELLRWSLDACLKLGDIATQGIVAGSLADLAAERGQQQEAIDGYRQAARLARESGSPYFAASWLAAEAEAQHRSGQLDAARRLFRDALDCAASAGVPVKLAGWQLQAAELELEAGARPAALALFRQAEALLQAAVAPDAAQQEQLNRLRLSLGLAGPAAASPDG